MARLEDVSADELRGYLEEVSGRRATLRLVVGINYKEGVPQTTLADWYGVSRTTIHNWLARLERLDEEPLEAVVYDADRPGRPPKLSADRREQLRSLLKEPPDAVGFDDASHWTPQLVHRLIEQEFGVTYSRRHVRELLSDLDDP